MCEGVGCRRVTRVLGPKPLGCYERRKKRKRKEIRERVGLSPVGLGPELRVGPCCRKERGFCEDISLVNNC